METTTTNEQNEQNKPSIVTTSAIEREMISLHVSNMRLIAALLKEMGDRFEFFACDDFTLDHIIPDVNDRRRLMRNVYEQKGTPEEYDKENSYTSYHSTELALYAAEVLQKNIQEKETSYK